MKEEKNLYIKTVITYFQLKKNELIYNNVITIKEKVKVTNLTTEINKRNNNNFKNN